MAVLQYFSEGLRELHKEILNHPPLVQQLKMYIPSDAGGRIGEIAAYCNVAMHGNYSPEDLEGLYPTLVHKLKDKRKIVVKTLH